MNNQYTDFFVFSSSVRLHMSSLFVSYSDRVFHRKYVDYMPVHWIDEQTLWFPPEGKSESVTQVIDKASWRKYRIRRIYWETHTFSKKEAERQSNELRRQEEREAEEVGETSTGTEADLPVRRRQDVTELLSQEASTLTPPSAPNSYITIYSRHNYHNHDAFCVATLLVIGSWSWARGVSSIRPFQCGVCLGLGLAV